MKFSLKTTKKVLFQNNMNSENKEQEILDPLKLQKQDHSSRPEGIVLTKNKLSLETTY